MSRASTLMLRCGAVAGALIYGSLAIGTGLDRLTFAHPSLAGRVPALFAVNALEVSGETQLDTAPDTATTLAQRLVSRAPVEPFSTALLGAARYASGDSPAADRAFRVAGQLGWRVPLTQAYWRQAALALGDFRVAAQRLDALLRQNPDVLHNPAALAPFESSPAAQAAWTDRLATRPPWLDWYTGKTDPVPTAALARRVPSLMLLSDRGVVLGCDAIAPAVQQLAVAGMASEAEALRRKHCPRGEKPARW